MPKFAGIGREGEFMQLSTMLGNPKPPFRPQDTRPTTDLPTRAEKVILFQVEHPTSFYPGLG